MQIVRQELKTYHLVDQVPQIKAKYYAEECSVALVELANFVQIQGPKITHLWKLLMSSLTET